MKIEDLLDFGLNDQQRSMRQLIRDFADAEIVPVVAQHEKDGTFPRQLVARLAELGVLGAIIPTAYGGSGFDYVTYGVICEEVARADWVCASVISVVNSLVASAIISFGNPEQKQRYLPSLARGATLASACLTEPDVGSDLANLRTSAVRVQNGYVLNGSKMFISHAQHADVLLVLATIDRGLKHNGICAFLVEKETPGIRTNALRLQCLRRGDVCEVVFEDVHVPSGSLLGQEGQGFHIIGAVLDTGRFSVASRCVGQAQACIEHSLNYARNRVAFGQEIGRFQMVQQMLADMITRTHAARMLVRQLGQAKDAGSSRLSLLASMAKMYASDVCMQAATDAVQIHGGYGLTEEYPVGRFLVEAKVLQIGEGTNQIHRMLIAENALGYRRG